MTETVAPAHRPTQPARRAKGRGLHRKGANTRQDARGKGTLPEYLLQHEVEGLIRLAPHGNSRLLMLIQWRAGLRISEALNLEARDVELDDANPTLRVRRGKGGRSRLVPVHPELAAALRLRLDYGGPRDANAKLIGVGRQQGSRWITQAVKRAVDATACWPGSGRRDKRAGTTPAQPPRRPDVPPRPVGMFPIGLGPRDGNGCRDHRKP